MSQILCDSHVHVGLFKDEVYFDPVQVARDMDKLGVKKWIFSTTSTGNLPFEDIKKEIETVIEASAGSAYPFLWVTPEMLGNSPNLQEYFFCRFYGIKIHGYNGWKPNGKKLERVFHIAEEKNLPVMLHTGGRSYCEAGMYLRICEKFSGVKVILAHGRPLHETIAVMKNCPNTYVDTAFMPTGDIKSLINLNLASRILFGTDYPITSYYYQTPKRTYYRRHVKNIKARIGEKAFWEISSNFLAIIL
jgi:predicted TIM-barrel fold metal-dependent hydrolase